MSEKLILKMTNPQGFQAERIVVQKYRCKVDGIENGIASIVLWDEKRQESYAEIEAEKLVAAGVTTEEFVCEIRVGGTDIIMELTSVVVPTLTEADAQRIYLEIQEAFSSNRAR